MIKDIDVDVPVRTAYDQWTQFEDFPLFMDYVDSVEQKDDRHVEWKVKIAGISREWEAEITEQTPDQRVAWTSVDGTTQSGVVTFHPLSDDHTRVVLQLEMDPQGLLETIADKGGFVSDRVSKDLESFKEFIEQRGKATGGYRDTITRSPHHGAERRRGELEGLSREELYKIAQERDLDNRSNMTKDELVDALTSDDES